MQSSHKDGGKLPPPFLLKLKEASRDNSNIGYKVLKEVTIPILFILTMAYIMSLFV